MFFFVPVYEMFKFDAFELLLSIELENKETYGMRSAKNFQETYERAIRDIGLNINISVANDHQNQPKYEGCRR